MPWMTAFGICRINWNCNTEIVRKTISVYQKRHIHESEKSLKKRVGSYKNAIFTFLEFSQNESLKSSERSLLFFLENFSIPIVIVVELLRDNDSNDWENRRLKFFRKSFQTDLTNREGWHIIIVYYRVIHYNKA